jgi:hypothetical protein
MAVDQVALIRISRLRKRNRCKRGGGRIRNDSQAGGGRVNGERFIDEQGREVASKESRRRMPEAVSCKQTEA